MGFYLVDSIYSSWATIVKTISDPLGQKKSHFAQRQEGAGNDVERAFGVPQACYAVVCGLAKQWDTKTLWEVMTCCVIMHNMIMEDEGECYL